MITARAGPIITVRLVENPERCDETVEGPAERLSPPEAAALTGHEAVIERGLRAFVEVGEALLAIRDRRLYRETHRTFEAYLRERWDLGRSHGYRVIEAARQVALVRDVSPNGDVPSSEAQARELTPVRSLNVRARIVERVERAGGWTALTAADVATIREEEAAAWRATQRRAESRARGRGFIQTLTALGSGDWSLADDFALDGQAPYGLAEGAPSELDRPARILWFEHALAGADALAADLPRLRARVAAALDAERAAGS